MNPLIYNNMQMAYPLLSNAQIRKLPKQIRKKDCEETWAEIDQGKSELVCPPGKHSKTFYCNSVYT